MPIQWNLFNHRLKNEIKATNALITKFFYSLNQFNSGDKIEWSERPFS